MTSRDQLQSSLDCLLGYRRRLLSELEYLDAEIHAVQFQLTGIPVRDFGRLGELNASPRAEGAAAEAGA
ncbi:MAG: hypothetical protein AB7N24_10195 [Dehalococcoidia bacterium]